MNDSDKKRFGLLVGALLEAYGQEATTARLYGYWIALRDIGADELETAVTVALRTSKQRVPSPAELLEIASGGSSESRAVAAWGEVQESATVSYMHDLDFEDRLINAVIRNLGGRTAFFARLGGGTESEKWLRIEFQKAYAVLARSRPSDEATAVLIGEADHGTVNGRTHNPPTVLIAGEPDRVRLLPPRSEQAAISVRPLSVPRVELKKA